MFYQYPERKHFKENTKHTTNPFNSKDVGDVYFHVHGDGRGRVTQIWNTPKVFIVERYFAETDADTDHASRRKGMPAY